MPLQGVQEGQVGRNGHEAESGGDRGGGVGHARRSENNNEARGASTAVAIIRISDICEEKINLQLKQAISM